jgi:translation initiation factor 2B subunit (eIF-2B alpha/beta/delta family)
MDKALARKIREIAQDDKSGAAELALQAIRALQAWAQSGSSLTPSTIRDAARALRKAHPEMAPLLRLAATIDEIAESPAPAMALDDRLAPFAERIAAAPAEIATRFLRALRAPRIRVAAYSYSSTVVRALIHACKRIELAYVSEGRPGNEGRTTAARLAHAGIRVALLPDVVLLSQLPPVSHVVFGADCILSNGFYNKTGSSLLMRAGLEAGAKVWILTDTLKFWPWQPPFVPSLSTCKPNWKFWDRPPARVRLLDQVHELVPYLPGIRFLTERGFMTPAAVLRELHDLRRRLQQMNDT